MKHGGYFSPLRTISHPLVRASSFGSSSAWWASRARALSRPRSSWITEPRRDHVGSGERAGAGAKRPRAEGMEFLRELLTAGPASPAMSGHSHSTGSTGMHEAHFDNEPASGFVFSPDHSRFDPEAAHRLAEWTLACALPVRQGLSVREIYF